MPAPSKRTVSSYELGKLTDEVTAAASTAADAIPKSLATASGQVPYSTGAGAWSVRDATASDTASTLLLRDASQVTSIGGLQIDTASTQTPATGKLIWDSVGQCLAYQSDASYSCRIGKDSFITVRNGEATPLAVGEVVYLTGSTGIHLIAMRASNATEAASNRALGIVAEAIAVSPGEGAVVTFGRIICNTNHLTEGALVYLGVGGATTATEPVPPAHLVILGTCLKKAGSGAGSILVRVTTGFELDELHDVLITAPAAGNLLIRNVGNTLWTNQAQSALTVAQSQVTNLTTDLGARVLKAGDTMTGPLAISSAWAAATGLLSLSGADALGYLPMLVRNTSANANSQAGMDFGFDNTHRVTFAVARSGQSAPFTSAAYFYSVGQANGLRFLTGDASDISFWANSGLRGTFKSAGPFEVGAKTSSTNSNEAKQVIYGATVNSTTPEVLLRMVRSEAAGVYYPSAVDFLCYSYGAGGAPNYYANSVLKIRMKNLGTFAETTAVDVLELRADGSVYLSQATATRPLWTTTGGLITTTPQTGTMVAVTTSATPVTVPATGGHVRVVGGAGAKAVALPAGAGVVIGTQVTVKDAAGNAASGTITVTANGTDTIDGAATTTITTNYGVARLILAAFSGGIYRWETC